MTQTEDLSLTTLGPLDGSAPRRAEAKHGWWWPLALGAAVCLLVGAAGGYLVAPNDDAAPPRPTPDAPRPALVIAPGSLLGQIGGTTPYPSTDGVARYDYAWPGQELVAPSSSTGEVVGHQWQLCDVPPAPTDGEEPTGRASLECAAVAGATGERFASPPTDRTRLVRVVVTLDLGNDVEVDAATVPIAALPWPATIQPGDPPPAARPSVPAVAR